MTLYLNGTTGISGVDGSSGTPAVQGTDTNTGISFPAADTIAFNEGGAEVGRFDSSGRLLVGTSTVITSTWGGTSGLFQVAKNDFLPVGLYSYVSTAADGWCPYFELHRARGTQASPSTVLNGDELGEINFYGHNGTAFYRGASIRSYVDGTPGAGDDMPGRLIFATTADGASSPTERMRITNAGAILINRTDRNTSELVSASGNCGDSGGLVVLKDTGAAGANRDFIRFYNASNSDIGAIEHNNTDTVAFITSSDYRLKENVVPLRNAIDRLAAIPVHRFNFISSPDITCDGFLAHEVQPIVPEAISGEKDAVNEDGSIRPQGIDQSKLVPLLTAALQEAIGEIESLKAEVAALKAQ